MQDINTIKTYLTVYSIFAKYQNDIKSDLNNKLLNEKERKDLEMYIDEGNYCLKKLKNVDNSILLQAYTSLLNESNIDNKNDYEIYLSDIIFKDKNKQDMIIVNTFLNDDYKFILQDIEINNPINNFLEQDNNNLIFEPISDLNIINDNYDFN
jgi:hypothetical protein